MSYYLTETLQRIRGFTTVELSRTVSIVVVTNVPWSTEIPNHVTIELGRMYRTNVWRNSKREEGFFRFMNFSRNFYSNLKEGFWVIITLYRLPSERTLHITDFMCLFLASSRRQQWIRLPRSETQSTEVPGAA